MKKRRTSVELPGMTAASPLAGLGGSGSPLPTAMKHLGMMNMDGSMSVVRQDDEASNSGLLELGPMLPMVRHSSDVRKHSLRTPILGPQESGQLLQPPPLKGKLRDLPRRPSTDAPFTQRPPAPRNLSETRAPSEDSNNSVIIHDETPPLQWEQSPEKNASESRVSSDASEGRSTLPARMRRWMHDAMKQHMYETAIFWGRHVVALERTSHGLTQRRRQPTMTPTGLRKPTSSRTNMRAPSSSLRHRCDAVQ